MLKECWTKFAFNYLFLLQASSRLKILLLLFSAHCYHSFISSLLLIYIELLSKKLLSSRKTGQWDHALLFLTQLSPAVSGKTSPLSEMKLFGGT